MPTHKISMQAIKNAVAASGNDVNVARILYQDIGVAIPDDATLASAGPHTSYHRKTREQAAEITAEKLAKKNVNVEGADAPVTKPDTAPAPTTREATREASEKLQDFLVPPDDEPEKRIVKDPPKKKRKSKKNII